MSANDNNNEPVSPVGSEDPGNRFSQVSADSRLYNYGSLEPNATDYTATSITSNDQAYYHTQDATGYGRSNTTYQSGPAQSTCAASAPAPAQSTYGGHTSNAGQAPATEDQRQTHGSNITVYGLMPEKAQSIFGVGPTSRESRTLDDIVNTAHGASRDQSTWNGVSRDQQPSQRVDKTQWFFGEDPKE